MKNISLLALFLSLSCLANAQVFNRLHAPVTQNSEQLRNPWAGGFNAPQWSAVDLNNDGKQDLYAFDRNGDKHICFLNVGGPGQTRYEFAPQYAANFPACRFYTLLRDYNHDGAMDLFACSLDEGVAGLKVFDGSYNSQNQLVFNRVSFPWIFDVLLIEAGGAPTQLPINATDYPAIDDIDGDGDLDVLALGITGSKVYWYKNIALEQGFTDDTLLFEQVDDCWGKFYIPAFSDSMLLSNDSDMCVFFQNPNGEVDERGGVHGGATICTFDEDNDGDKEVLYGDLLYPNLIWGKNCGTNQNAWICEQDNHFPSYDSPINIIDFPAAFYLDVDNDGLKDMLSSTNDLKATDINTVWYYKNIQSNEYPLFEFKSDAFIADGMIDVGTGAYPAFFDYNIDGLPDFVVGNQEHFTSALSVQSKLFLYKNVGTPTEPAFELVDDDWLNFSQFIDPQLQPSAFTPTFGDLDGDGDLDLIVGERYGRLFYAENTAGPGNAPSFPTITPYWLGFSVGQFSAPCIHDMNKDGLGDLIIGEYKGTLNYLPNMGTVGNPVFNTNLEEAPNNEYFGGISTQQPGYSTGFSAPTVIETPNGELFLVVGTELGFLKYYKVVPENMEVFGAPFELIDDKLGAGMREGWNSHPSFVDLNGDEFLDCLVGNQRGGLALYSSPIAKDGSVDAHEVSSNPIGVELYPNPANNELFVKIKTEGNSAAKYRIFNALGQFASSGDLDLRERSIDVSDLGQGLYFLEIQVGEGRVTKRFVKE